MNRTQQVHTNLRANVRYPVCPRASTCGLEQTIWRTASHGCCPPLCLLGAGPSSLPAAPSVSTALPSVPSSWWASGVLVCGPSLSGVAADAAGFPASSRPEAAEGSASSTHSCNRSERTCSCSNTQQVPMVSTAAKVLSRLGHTSMLEQRDRRAGLAGCASCASWPCNRQGDWQQLSLGDGALLRKPEV